MKAKIILAIAVTVIAASCSKSFIELDDKQNLTENTFWLTRQDAIQGITAAYAALQGHDGSKWTLFEEVYTTLNYKGDDIDNNPNEPYGKTLASFTNGAEESGPWNLWATCYAGIARSNQVIENVPGIEAVSEQERNEIVGEAKFLRAYNYFILVNGFENVPLVLKFEKDIEKLQAPQANPADVWKQIEDDLRDAEQVLPESYPDAFKGRVTRNAAKSLLGKAYLFQEKWSDAENKFREVHGKYTLLDNYENNFNGLAENGSESVFEIQFSGDRSIADERHSFNFEVAPYVLDGWELLYPSDWLVEEMKKDVMPNGDYSKRVYGSLFFDAPGSEMWNLATPAEMVSYASVASQLTRPSYFKKYAYPYDRGGAYPGSNISVIRYADVLLMYAEALNENNKSGDAIDIVNEVRARSGAVALNIADFNQVQLREWIRHHERPVELAMEWGIRWFDLIRWGRGNTAKLNVKDLLTAHSKPFASNYVENKHLRYPIPSREMAVNPSLTQNNGY